MQDHVGPVEPGQEQSAGSSTTKSEVLQRIGLVLGSLAFGLFLLEIPASINLVNYGRILGVNGDWLPRKWIADSELVHIGQPHAHISGSSRGGFVLLDYRIPESDL